MNITLWIVQVVLALTFLASGVNKLARPRLALAGQLPYVEDFSDAQVIVTHMRRREPPMVWVNEYCSFLLP